MESSIYDQEPPGRVNKVGWCFQVLRRILDAIGLLQQEALYKFLSSNNRKQLDLFCKVVIFKLDNHKSLLNPFPSPYSSLCVHSAHWSNSWQTFQMCVNNFCKLTIIWKLPPRVMYDKWILWCLCNFIFILQGNTTWLKATAEFLNIESKQQLPHLISPYMISQCFF